MKLDSSLIRSVQVLCSLNGNLYYPTGKTCRTCRGNDDINDPIGDENDKHSFCAERSLLDRHERDVTYVRKFIETANALQFDTRNVVIGDA